MTVLQGAHLAKLLTTAIKLSWNRKGRNKFQWKVAFYRLDRNRHTNYATGVSGHRLRHDLPINPTTDHVKIQQNLETCGSDWSCCKKRSFSLLKLVSLYATVGSCQHCLVYIALPLTHLKAPEGYAYKKSVSVYEKKGETKQKGSRKSPRSLWACFHIQNSAAGANGLLHLPGLGK